VGHFLIFAGLFVLVEVCATMGLLEYIGSPGRLHSGAKAEDKQLHWQSLFDVSVPLLQLFLDYHLHGDSFLG
jgi:hypothetical protein